MHTNISQIITRQSQHPCCTERRNVHRVHLQQLGAVHHNRCPLFYCHNALWRFLLEHYTALAYLVKVWIDCILWLFEYADGRIRNRAQREVSTATSGLTRPLLSLSRVSTNITIWLFSHSCAIKNSRYPSCRAHSGGNSSTEEAAASNKQLFISHDDIMIGLDPINPNDAPNPIWFNTLCLLCFLLFFRLLGYFVLRVYHKPA